MASIEATKPQRGADGKPLYDQKTGRPLGLPGSKYKIRYRDESNRERSTTIDGTWTDAKRWIERNGADQQRGDWLDPQLRRRKFEDWGEAWLPTIVNLAPRTQHNYKQHYFGKVLPYFKGFPIGAIDRQDVKLFIADSLKRHKPRQVKNAVGVLSRVMAAAVDAGARKDNPAANQSVRVPKEEPLFFSMAQIEKLLAVVAEKYQALFLVLIFTGIRPSELCGIKLDSVDLVTGILRITRTLTPVGSTLVEGPPKNNQFRSIPLPPVVIDAIASMLAQRRERGERLDGDAWVFVNGIGNPWNADRLRKNVIRPALKRAELPSKFRTYDFRHSHASLLIAMGAHPKEIMERLGHSEIGVTMNTYGHLFAGAQEKLTAAFEAAHFAAREAAAKGDDEATIIEFRPSASEAG